MSGGVTMIKKEGRTWSVRAYWRDSAGKRHSRYCCGFSTKSAAEAWENDVIKKNSHATFADAHRLTVSQLSKLWLENLISRKRAPSTIQSYEYSLMYILPRIGGLIVQDVRRGDIQRVFDDISKNEKMSAETVRHIARGARSLFSFAIKSGIIVYSPFIKIDLPAARIRPMIKYDAEQINKLVMGMREQRHVLYFLVVFCVMYGLRRGEAAAVRWCDIDFKTGIVNVRGSISCPNTDMFYGPTKTTQSADTISLSGWFLDDLKSEFQNRISEGKIYMPVDLSVTDHIVINKINPLQFVSLDENSNVLRVGGIPGRLKRFQRANKLPETSVHDLRKNYATILKESGVDISVISKALRHSSVNITARQYIANTAPIKKQATTAMDNIIFLNKNTTKMDIV